MSHLKKRFIELATASNWSQAEIARRLDQTRGGVNGIITGDKEPSKALVRLFEFVLMAEKPDVLKGSVAIQESPRRIEFEAIASSEFDELIGKLAELTEEERTDLLEHFKGIAEMISSKGRTKKY